MTLYCPADHHVVCAAGCVLSFATWLKTFPFRVTFHTSNDRNTSCSIAYTGTATTANNWIADRQLIQTQFRLFL